eukprot:scaffold108131_cov36-Phaeocystis_antarctica.AAC.1
MAQALGCADGGTTAPHRGLSGCGSHLKRVEQPSNRRIRPKRPGCRAVALPRRPASTSCATEAAATSQRTVDRATRSPGAAGSPAKARVRRAAGGAAARVTSAGG